MSSVPNTPNNLFLGISSTPEFLTAVDEESISICPLLTPSPSANFHHPLAMNSLPGYERQLSPSSEDTEISTLPASLAANSDFQELDNASKNTESNTGRLLTNGGLEGSSSSSSCSVMQDSTASAQLLNYLSLSADPSSQEKGAIKTATLLGLSKSAQEYSFVNWNWTAIRKWCFWGVMSLTVACVCVIIGYMTTIPRRCDPPRAWYQGSLIYQLFPPSFQDSDANGIGDLRGVFSRIGYFEKLGVKGVRLSYIFQTEHYPEHFDKINNLTLIDKNIGDFDAFRTLVDGLHRKNISIILDLPLYPYFDDLKVRPREEWEDKEVVKHVIVNNHILVNAQNKTRTWGPERGEITDILTFWLNNGVDGFYLQGLEHFVNDDKFISQVLEWRTEMNRYSQTLDKILICSEEVVDNIQQLTISDAESKLDIVMRSFDLINVKIDPFTEGTKSIKHKLDRLQNGVIYSKPAFPWVYWTSGDMDTPRLASRAAYGNLSLATILTTMVLPGTSGIFYGDEIALLEIHDPEDERKDLKHAHHLGPMHWSDTLSVGFSQGGVLPWLPVSGAKLPLNSANIISSMSTFRDSNPGIYMKAIWKNQQLSPSAAIRYIDDSVVTIERAYPRRHTYLLLANLGENCVTRDLSSHYYGGDTVLDTTLTPARYVTFHKTKLVPGQVILSKLDK